MKDKCKQYHKLKILFIGFILVFSKEILHAQSCPDGLVYIFGNPIRAFDPNLPFSATNPVTTSIVPPVGSALAFGPNINAAFPSPTFYTISGGFYHYWNGTGWTNTNHLPGSTIATNIAVGPGCLYNLVGSSGQVYSYNGTGNGTLLFTIPGFSGGGPYDLVTDNCCNIYVLKSTVPQSLSVYDPTGNLIASCSLSNLPAVIAGTGFAIAGNKVVVFNSSGVYVGTTGSSVITFTYVGANFGGGGSDLGSCPVDCNSACSVVLPIEFEWLKCSKQEQSNLIEWKMQFQDNIQFYGIEKSQNAIDFNSIGTVSKTSDQHYYSFTDQSQESGNISYYRIKAVEVNGFVKYSRIASILETNELYDEPMVFPNPCNESVTIKLNEERNAKVTVRIIDKLGNIHLNEVYDLADDMLSLKVNTHQLFPGLYTISIMMDTGKAFNKKLVKMNH